MDTPTQENYGARKFFYNNALFLVQSLVSMLGLGFSAGMLITDHDAGVYLPVMTSIIFFWCPSPLNHQVQQPSGIPQIRNLLRNNANNV